jgi:hypothetical protein
MTEFPFRLNSRAAARCQFTIALDAAPGSTGRLRTACWIDRISLSRSNGVRRPLFLITTQVAQLHALERR